MSFFFFFFFFFFFLFRLFLNNNRVDARWKHQTEIIIKTTTTTTTTTTAAAVTLQERYSGFRPGSHPIKRLQERQERERERERERGRGRERRALPWQLIIADQRRHGNAPRLHSTSTDPIPHNSISPCDPALRSRSAIPLLQHGRVVHPPPPQFRHA